MSKQAAIPIGTFVSFTTPSLGASRRDELHATTGEVYGPGDSGVVAFPHPNRKACPNWVYVEVDSKEIPGEKRYVGVTARMVSRLDDTEKPALSWEEVVHSIAQGAINIDEGLTNVEKGSPIHKAMHAFCAYLARNEVKFTGEVHRG